MKRLVVKGKSDWSPLMSNSFNSNSNSTFGSLSINFRSNTKIKNELIGQGKDEVRAELEGVEPQVRKFEINKFLNDKN